MIEIKQLSKSYGQIQALNGINLHFRRGESIGLLGPNGAGKSTFMRIVSGYIQASEGDVFISGHNIISEEKEAQKYLGYVAESCPLYLDMTVYEYLRYVADLWQVNEVDFEQNIQIILKNLYLADVLNRKIETLSKGYRHRVGIAGALIHKPQILMLDEPTEGLDPNQKHQIHQFIREYGKEKLVSISTHIMEEVEAMTDRVILINKGKVVADMSPQELKQLTPDNSIYSAFKMLTEEK